MRNIVIKNNKLKGEVTPPASKSILHRYIIGASLAKGISKIRNVDLSEDIEATINAMKNLGAKIEIRDRELLIEGSSLFCVKNKINENIEINCRESGSTLRFLIPISLVKENKVIFKGENGLFKRPLDPYFNIFDKNEIIYNFQPEKEEKLFVNGKLKSGIYEVIGNISSQFITGLLFSLPLLEGKSIIKIKGNLESKSYIDLTLDCLHKFGIKFKNNDYKSIEICGSQEYKALNIDIETDFSQAAFFLVANFLGADLEIKNINLKSLQGDKKIIDFIENLKNVSNDYLEIDGSNCPDIIPIFSLCAAYSNKKVKIINVARLRIKESDRLNSTVTELKKFGFDLEGSQDTIYINHNLRTNLKNEILKLSSHNDHRIAMMIAIASTVYTNKIVLEDANSVRKSYPNFWEVFISLGGEIYEYMGE